jgi:DNA-binding response OmpR family regulator
MMTGRARILIVDDEEAIRFSLEELLVRDGYEVVAVESGEQALTLIADHIFDLALLDLRLKGISGLRVLAALRERALDTAVIVLTAHGSMETAIDALRQGAHDYLLKPTDAASLRESVRTALLKRERELRQQALLLQVQQSLTASLEEIRTAVVNSLPVPQADAAKVVRSLQRGGLVVGLAEHVVTLDGKRLDLSRTEFDVLVYLAEKAPSVISPQELVRHVQGFDSNPIEASDMIRPLIHRIREKAKSRTGRPEFIRSVRGVGYALEG